MYIWGPGYSVLNPDTYVLCTPYSYLDACECIMRQKLVNNVVVEGWKRPLIRKHYGKLQLLPAAKFLQ